MNEEDQKIQTDIVPLDGPVDGTAVPLSGKERASIGHVKRWFSVTLFRKNLMALTGLFLCFFLVIHLFGNLQLLLPEKVAHWQFNFYSKLLSENIFIEIIAYVLFASICMVALGYHLLHGFFSAARTLGVYHPRYVIVVKVVGWLYSIGISAGFALVPLFVHFARS
jgi:succinate dehydrogenase / fumarate reductase cytochrome b subunit